MIVGRYCQNLLRTAPSKQFSFAEKISCDFDVKVIYLGLLHCWTDLVLLHQYLQDYYFFKQMVCAAKWYSYQNRVILYSYGQELYTEIYIHEIYSS